MAPADTTPPAGQPPARDARRTVLWKLTAHYDGIDLPGYVRNVSPGGALIELPLPLAQGTLLRLDVPEIGMLGGVIQHQDGVFHGIRFVESRQAVLQRFAARARALGFVSDEQAPGI